MKTGVAIVPPTVRWDECALRGVYVWPPNLYFYQDPELHNVSSRVIALPSLCQGREFERPYVHARGQRGVVVADCCPWPNCNINVTVRATEM